MVQRILAGVIFCFLIYTGWGAGEARAQDIVKVGILPLQVYAADREKLGDWPDRVARILSRELAKEERILPIEQKEIDELLSRSRLPEMDEFAAREIGRRVDADYMLYGSISQINGSISLDVRILDVLQEGVLGSAFVAGKGMENLEALTVKMSQELNIKVLKKESIAKILVEGNNTIEESAIRAPMKMKEGDILSPKALRDDVKAIYQLGFFQDVRAEKRAWGREKAVVFIVEEKPIIKEVKFSGNKALKISELQEAMDLKPRTVLNLNAVKENRNKILQKYRDEAYFLAEVNYELETPKKGEVIVHYKIQENKKIRIQAITFSGNLHFSDETLKKLLPETQEEGWFSWATKSGTYKEDVLERDLDAILAYYFSKGFIQAKIGKPQVSYDAKGMKITIPVDEGIQFRVGKVEIQGDLIAPKDELFKKVSLYPGEILNRENVRETVSNLTDLYADKGYAFVDVDPQTVLKAQEQQADISITIRQGSLVYFERINILGNTKTRDKVIRRELQVVEGDLYSLTAVKKSRERLQQLSYFKEINLNTKKGSGDDKLDMSIQVEEGPTGNFSIGGGYSTTDKLTAVINIAQNNLFGRGQRLSLSSQFGSITQLYTLSFTEPYLFDTRVSGTGELYRLERVYDEYSIKRSGGGARVGFPLFEEVRGFTQYRYEEIDTFDIEETASQEIKDQEGISTTSSVLGALRRDTRDHFFDPSKGSDNLISVEYAGGFLGGSNAFNKYEVNTVWFVTPFWKTTFSAHGRIGYVQSREGKEVPLYERYRLGGIHSLRGFDAYSVGTKDPVTGSIIGGTEQLVLNFEMVFPLIPVAKIKGLFFFDAGNAWDRSSPYNENPSLSDLRTSAGFGFRWISPVGPLRIEWGYNLSPKPGEQRSGWDFAIGAFY